MGPVEVQPSARGAIPGDTSLADMKAHPFMTAPPKGPLAPATAPASGDTSDAAELAASQRGDTAAVRAAQQAQNAPRTVPAMSPSSAGGPVNAASTAPAGSLAAYYSQLENERGLPQGYLAAVRHIESADGTNTRSPNNPNPLRRELA